MASILKVTEITTPDGTGNITVSRPLSSVQLGGVLDVNGNYVQTEKGGDIASASPLVIDTDGDYFDVTGTTNFAAMTVAADRQFTLQFDGALTMTHHATNLDLPGEANITTAAGDVAVFQSTGADTVQCIAYTKADGTPVVSSGVTASGCSVYRNTTQSIPNATHTKVEYNTAIYDLLGEFDSTTNHRFVANATGNYLVMASTYFTDMGATDNYNMHIYKNGADNVVHLKISGRSSTSLTVVGIVQLDATEYVEAFVYQGSGGAINTYGSATGTFMHVQRLS